MKTLVVIPARGGSKGIPGKNIKNFLGKPLIYYTIEIARELFSDSDICVSTDDETIKNCVNEIGLKVPFMRPAHLATDQAGTYEVLLHAVQEYKEKSVYYDHVLLLQPTTPIRNVKHIQEMMDLKRNKQDIEMVVSVKESKENPYFSLFEEDSLGLLKKSKDGNFTRRQDCPKVYAYNGSIYLISVEALKNKKISGFKRIKKYLMEEDIYNIDIDTLTDWFLAEITLKYYKES